VWTIGPHIRY